MSLLKGAGPMPVEDFSFLEVVGKGQYGSVWKCEDVRTGEPYACKVVPKALIRQSLVLQRMLRNEADMLAFLSGKHRNVLDLAYTFEDNDAVHFVSEFCSSGDLYSLLDGGNRRLSEAEYASLFAQLATAIQFCHSHGIVHRDIKPENILLTSSCSYSAAPPRSSNLQVKVADFGMAVRLAAGEKAVDCVGSLLHQAPEVFFGRPYDAKADVWSMGVVLYELVVGKAPLLATDERHMRQLMHRRSINFSPRGVHLSKPLQSLLKGMLEFDQSKRMNATDVVSHPWFRAAHELSAKESSFLDPRRVDKAGFHGRCSDSAQVAVDMPVPTLIDATDSKPGTPRTDFAFPLRPLLGAIFMRTSR